MSRVYVAGVAPARVAASHEAAIAAVAVARSHAWSLPATLHRRGYSVVRTKKVTFDLAPPASSVSDGDEQMSSASGIVGNIDQSLPPSLRRTPTSTSVRTLASTGTGASFHTAYEDPVTSAGEESDSDQLSNEEDAERRALMDSNGIASKKRHNDYTDRNGPIKARTSTAQPARKDSLPEDDDKGVYGCCFPTSWCKNKQTLAGNEKQILFQSLVIVREQHTKSQLMRRSLKHRNKSWKEYTAFLTASQVGQEIIGKELLLCAPKATNARHYIEKIALDKSTLCLRLHYPLDFSFSLRDTQTQNMHVFHCASTELSMLWYTALYCVLPMNTKLPYPECIDVHVPDLDMRVRVPLSSVPPLSVWDARRIVLAQIDKHRLIDDKSHEWRKTNLRMCWRRGERLEWIEEDDEGINTLMFSPRVIEGSHLLEIRPAETLLRTILITPDRELAPSASFEGYLGKRHFGRVMSDTYETAYFSSHSHFLFYTRSPYVLPHEHAMPPISPRKEGETYQFNSKEEEEGDKSAYTITNNRHRNETHVLNSSGFINLLEVETIEIPGSCADCHRTLSEFLNVAIVMPQLIQSPRTSSSTMSQTNDIGPPALPLIVFTIPLTIKKNAPHMRHRINTTGSEFDERFCTCDFVLHTALGRVYLRTERHEDVHTWVRLLASTIRYFRWHHRELLREEKSMMRSNRALAEVCMNKDEMLHRMQTSARLWGSIPDDDVVKLSTPLFTRSKTKGKSFLPGFYILTRTHMLRYTVSKRTHMYKLSRSVALSNRSHVLSGYIDPRTGEPLTAKHGKSVKLYPAQVSSLEDMMVDDHVRVSGTLPRQEEQTNTLMSHIQLEGVLGELDEKEFSSDDDDKSTHKSCHQTEPHVHVSDGVNDDRIVATAARNEMQRENRTMDELLPSLMDTYVTSSEVVTEIAFSLWSAPRRLQWFKRRQQRGQMSVYRSRWKLEKQMWMVCMQRSINSIVSASVSSTSSTTAEMRTARDEMNDLQTRIVSLMRHAYLLTNSVTDNNGGHPCRAPGLVLHF